MKRVRFRLILEINKKLKAHIPLENSWYKLIEKLRRVFLRNKINKKNIKKIK